MPAAPIRILIVAALSVLALIGLVTRETLARDKGAEVVMAMQPVDPQSLLSGHFVVVGLSEPLAPGLVCPPGAQTGVFPYFDPAEARRQWVALGPRSGHTTVVAVAATRAEALRASPVAAMGDAYCMPPVPPDQAGVIITSLGVDRFHVGQAEAEAISGQLGAARVSPQTATPVSALISIGADGRARMKGLLVGRRRIELSWF